MSRLLLTSLLAFAGCTTGRNTPDGGGGDVGFVENRCTSSEDGDGDGLFDMFEGTRDSDGDGTPDAADHDSDEDSLPDADESGALGGCAARDTDRDTFPDYRDNDSDNDGLGDREEVERYSTDPRSPDSDGDGFIDVAETATGHDPNDAADGIPDRDFYVVLPYMPSMGAPELRELRFGTNVRQADVFFMMDRTGSMTGEVAQLKSSLDRVVTEITARIPNIGVGFGGFAGFGGPAGGPPVCVFGICSYPDGPDGDVPFNLYGVITTDLAQMRSDLAMLEADQGGANWASSNEALYQAATGAGIAPWVRPQMCPFVPDDRSSRYGYPCFRPGSLPIMVVMTDTSSKNGPMTAGVAGGTYDPALFTMGPPPHTYDQTRTELQRIGARVIGVLSGTEITNPTPRQQFEAWARDTGTVSATGAPIVFTISPDGSGLGDSIIEAIRVLAEETPQDIGAVPRDGDDIPPEVGPIDATQFIKAITPLQLIPMSGPLVPCPDASRCDDRLFYQVSPGDFVDFRLRFLNDFVPPRATVQVFRATITVVGNGVAELDTRDVVIVVPAGSEIVII
jgi:hypothetical protein